MTYLDEIIAACKTAKSAKPMRSFIMKELNDLTSIKQAVYVIKEIEGDQNATFEALKKFKATKDRKCSKLNHPSSVLYVGSSRTDLKKRIKEHLGEGYKDTYALHISHWAPRSKIEIEIREYEQEPLVLQLIEDALSDELKPAFGKQGGNNKA